MYIYSMCVFYLDYMQAGQKNGQRLCLHISLLTCKLTKVVFTCSPAFFAHTGTVSSDIRYRFLHLHT
jgi:hypothetical protein